MGELPWIGHLRRSSSKKTSAREAIQVAPGPSPALPDPLAVPDGHREARGR
eukprot:CAMPEP_0171551200 /NCGR_PEP_ID=MMETSP0960-20121227/7553_1 /TAXON_ID=87120 /ORGANISM="Aurantiochytrium limacinum, Strain ATCCMYA-1381" /LENGTH=50 /DNA_ID=CAMNT_0012100351 /DNA_START=1059 /DNA_END=1207 /DNA_ORIENTATION=-